MLNFELIPPVGQAEDALSYVGGNLVQDFPRFDFDLNDVKQAGKAIAGDLPWTEDSAPDVLRAFQIANNWRDAHAYPMRSIRLSVAWYMRALQIEGVTAARLKRMQAIRRKLRRLPLGLNKLQDLGGCRAILPTIEDVSLLVDVLKNRTRHHLRSERNYITNPKDDGYRSHHLMFDYRGKGDAKAFDNRRVEVQIRTRMQHSWATAVEAVGLMRREDLKGHKGSEKWLRLFKLMSAEFALAENCTEPAGLPSQRQRIIEIKSLDKELNATSMLTKISYAVRWTDEAVQPSSKPTYYLIRFNNATQQVEIDVTFAPKWAVAQYDQAELSDNKSGIEASNIVLVEADKVENLKDAYPNYFGDVQLFKWQLSNIVKGKGVQEYVVKPQDTVAPRPRENPDTAWLRRRIRWR